MRWAPQSDQKAARSTNGSRSSQWARADSETAPPSYRTKPFFSGPRPGPKEKSNRAFRAPQGLELLLRVTLLADIGRDVQLHGHREGHHTALPAGLCALQLVHRRHERSLGGAAVANEEPERL